MLDYLQQRLLKKLLCITIVFVSVGVSSALTLHANTEKVEKSNAASTVSYVSPSVMQDSSFVKLIGNWVRTITNQYGSTQRGASTFKSALSFGDPFLKHSKMLYVRSVFDQALEQEYSTAASVYLSILEAINSTPSKQEAVHLLEMCPVVPAEERSEMGLPTSCKTVTDIQEGEPVDGLALAQWWRREDDDWASSQNNRLEEHLQRVSEARRSYTHDGVIDDRGRIYIRYGNPHKQRTVRIDERTNRSRSNQLTTSIGSIARYEDNELWLYTGIDREANYLFVNKPGSGYQLGEAMDLIPRRLISSGRQVALALDVMEYVYRQLSVHIHDYGRTYDTVADLQSRVQFGTLGGPGDSDLDPQRIISNSTSQARRDERRVQDVRERVVPISHSEEKRNIATFSPGYRTARFRNQDGTTRTEIYWALPEDSRSEIDTLPTTEPLQEGQYSEISKQQATSSLSHINTTAIQDPIESEQLRRRDAERHSITSEGGPRDNQHHTTVIEGDSIAYDIRLQLDQYVGKEHDKQRTDALARTAQIYINEITPFETKDYSLLVSDIKPLYVSEPQKVEQSPPYPYSELDAQIPLGLYFEVYNLTFGKNDRAVYQVEYMVEQTRERGGVLGFLRGDATEQITATSYRYETQSTQAEDYVILDLNDLSNDGTLEITVTVKDITTEAESSRTITFDVES